MNFDDWKVYLASILFTSSLSNAQTFEIQSNRNWTLKSSSNISRWKCVCVCMYVRRPAAGPTQPITPKFGMGSSFHPGSAPSQGATQNVGPQGYLPYWPHLKFPEGLRIGRGPANKSCSSGWVCNVKFYLWGAHPNPGPTGSTLPNGGICNENWAGPSK